MADIEVEKKETQVVEKITTEEVDPKKDIVEEEATTTENGEAEAAESKENKGSETVVEAEEKSEAPVSEIIDGAEKSEEPASVEPTTQANGDAEAIPKEANGDSKDSASAETVKRKVDESETKSDGAVATPEKKTKLDEAIKEDAQNGSEASELAA